MHVSYIEPLSDLRRILVFMEAVVRKRFSPSRYDTITKKKDLSFRGTCETQFHSIVQSNGS